MKALDHRLSVGKDVVLVLDHAVRAGPRGTTTDLVVTAPSVFALGYAPVARLALHRLVRA